MLHAAPVMMLRNHEQHLVKLKKPMILGMVDGPFLSIISLASPETGCFECFEQRVMARLDDIAAYRSFVQGSVKMAAGKPESEKSYSPLVALLISAVLSEGFLTSSVKINKTSGRVINVYLPTLEIPGSGSPGVPYCPACGP
jgi:thiazole/oxazole-forming peptide maturase SagC family component